MHRFQIHIINDHVCKTAVAIQNDILDFDEYESNDTTNSAWIYVDNPTSYFVESLEFVFALELYREILISRNLEHCNVQC